MVPPQFHILFFLERDFFEEMHTCFTTYIQGQKYLFRLLQKFKSCFGKSKDAFLWCLLSETPDYYLNPVLTNHPHVYEALTIEHL